MRARSSPSDGAASGTRSCYTGDEGSSIMSIDLSHGCLEFVEYLQPVRIAEDELAENEVPEEIADPDFYGIDKTSTHKYHASPNVSCKESCVCIRSHWEEVSRMPSRGSREMPVVRVD